jgi:outer membrane receptor protein involved in Fe transport
MYAWSLAMGDVRYVCIYGAAWRGTSSALYSLLGCYIAPDYKNSYYALFVQDSWRTTDRLTLTAGLRWDTESPQIERHGEANIGFNPGAAYNFAGQSLTGEVQFPTGGQNTAYNWDKNNFGPRFGLSYRPYPQGYLKPAGANTNLNGQGGWTYWPNRTLNIPRTTQFSLGVEYELPYRSILDVRYVGELTNNLPNSRNPNFISLATSRSAINLIVQFQIHLQDNFPEPV